MGKKYIQLARVWHSSLTAENTKDLERIQEAAVRLIIGRRHINYNTSLSKLNLEELPEQREILCLNVAKRTILNKKTKHIFPHKKYLRSVNRGHTETYLLRNAQAEGQKTLQVPTCRTC